MEAKKSTGSFVNFGFGGPASSSDSFPQLIQRTNSGTLTQIQVSNPSTDAQSGAGYELVVDNGAGSFMIQARVVGSIAPDAYAGGGGILRTSGTVPGIRFVADDAATANIKFYAGGNAAGDFVVGVDQYGLRLTPEAAAQPTCTSGIKGQLYYKPGGAGVSDTIEMCMKAAADTYGWVVVKSAP
jgi:hypothetical protein